MNVHVLYTSKRVPGRFAILERSRVNLVIAKASDPARGGAKAYFRICSFALPHVCLPLISGHVGRFKTRITGNQTSRYIRRC